MKPFSLLVKPTSADCNLRCEYCFYLPKSELYPETGRHRMSVETLERMISSYMATQQPCYSFGWQGGEPTLMGVDFFRSVTEFQVKYGVRGCQVSNGLQTNGTLIEDDLAQHLAKFRFLLGVSLDGPAEVHDRYRRTSDARPSHAAVLRGIDVLRKRQVEFNTLTLVSQSNVRKAREIYRYLRDQGFLYHQYIECVEFADDGHLLPYAISGPEWGEFLCRLFDEWVQGDTRLVSIRLFDSILARMLDGVANVCSMDQDCRQYFVVEYNGDVYPCDFYVRRDLRLGNVMTHTWEQMSQSAEYRNFGLGKRDTSAVCPKCEYYTFCGGDCQKHRHVGTGADSRLSILCEGWKEFYRHTLPRFRHLAEGIRKERRMLTSSQGVGSGHIPERNSLCPCGSGRKFKKCCGV